MTLNLDCSFFSVICDLGNCLYTPETELDNMNFRQIVRDIRDGQLENVRAVLEYNPAEGWCNDVTGEILAAARPELKPGSDAETDEDWSDYRSERIDGPLAGVRLHTAVSAALQRPRVFLAPGPVNSDPAAAGHASGSAG